MLWRFPRKAIAPLAVALTAAALMGCAASSTSTSAGSASFKASANLVCGVFYKATYGLPAPVGMKQIEELVVKQQRLREQELSRLEKVTAPSSERSAFKRYLADAGELQSLYAALLRTGASSSFKELSRRGAKLEASVKAQAQSLGLDECAEDPYRATHVFASSSKG